MGCALNQRLQTDRSSGTPKEILYPRPARENARNNCHCCKARVDSGGGSGSGFPPLNYVSQTVHSMILSPLA